MTRRRNPHILLDFDFRSTRTVLRTARKLQQRERHLSRVFLAMKLVWMLTLQMFVQLVLRRQRLSASGDCAREEPAFGVPLDVSLELTLVVEERRTQSARVFTPRRDLGLYRDPVSSKVVVELRDRVVLLWTLTAYVLLDLVVSFHVIVEIRDLSEGSPAVVLDADEGTLAGVETTVVVEVCDLRERFTAVDAEKFTKLKKIPRKARVKTHQTYGRSFV